MARDLTDLIVETKFAWDQMTIHSVATGWGHQQGRSGR